MASVDLLPKGWKVLVDAPEDHAAEEACWVPVAFASTEAEVVAIVEAERVAMDATLTVAGKEWWRRNPLFKPVEHGFRDEEAGVMYEFEPWWPCSKFAEDGVEFWRVEVEYA